MKSVKIKTLVQVALLVAIEIVLSRFCSIATPVVKIGFGFVPIAVCAMLYGPVWAGVAGGVADLLGAVLFPIGPYFPGFTLSAVLTGVVFGLLLWKRHEGWRYTAAAVAINCLVISLLLNTLWLSILSGTPFWGQMIPRVVQNAIMIPVQFVVLQMLGRPVNQYAARGNI